MSMHKKPLTLIEETGLILHGLGDCIGKASQPADIFRHGVAWGQASVLQQLADIQKSLNNGMPFDDTLRDRLAELLKDMALATVSA